MKKLWIATLPLALALAACTTTAPSSDGTSSDAADDGTIATASPTPSASETPSASAEPQGSTSAGASTTPNAASGPASLEASMAPEPGGGAAGSYGYIVKLTNKGGQPATLSAPYVATLHDKANANLSNTQPLDFTHGAPTATLQPGESAQAILIVHHAELYDRCKPLPASFLNIDSASGTLQAPIDELHIQGCDGGLVALLSAVGK